jgi:hypothetical protein
MLSVLAPVAYKPIMIIDDDSSVINNLETSPIDNARVIIYDRHMLIVQATSKNFKDQNSRNESGSITSQLKPPTLEQVIAQVLHVDMLQHSQTVGSNKRVIHEQAKHSS